MIERGKALCKKVLNRLKHYLIKIVCLVNKSALKPYQQETLKHQPIFIIGAPRTGSTILYQALTNYYELSYIDNCVDRWHQNLFYGFKKSYKKFGNSPHNNFQAKFGSTSLFSEHGPAECGGFWYRWLPKERHFIDFNEVPPKAKLALYSEVCAVTNYFDKPIIFKNLNAGQRLRFIKEVFPKAKFIYIRRDHKKVSASIIRARRANNVPGNLIWSIKPKGFEALQLLPEKEMVDMQIQKLEGQIEKDLHLFEDVIELNFNELSEEKIKQLGTFLGIPRRDGGNLPSFHKDNNG